MPRKKKMGLSVVLFIGTFALVYVCLCYAVPGWRLKLAADGLTYFLASLKKLAVVKFLLSLGAGLIASCIPAFVQKKRG